MFVDSFRRNQFKFTMTTNHTDLSALSSGKCFCKRLERDEGGNLKLIIIIIIITESVFVVSCI